MSQVNKYANKAGYTADKNRKDTQSAVSYIEDDGALIYDGVNVVVDKPAAGVGDLAVFDKTTGTIRFVKGATLVAEQLSPQLVPVAVVYARQGERVLIVSLRNAASSVCWAYSYEVALSGFELSAGGTFTLRIYNTDHAFTYAPGATLADIAAQINADEKIKNTYGWTASVDEAGARIVMSINTWSPNYVLINVTNGCQITYPRENVSYQTTLTGILIKGTREEIRRKNGVNSNMAGGVLDQFAEYYSERGQAATGQKPGSGIVIRESVFTEADNPDLVAVYPTYKDYLFAEHMAQYPTEFGTMLQDGKTNTNLIGRLTFEDIYGKTQYRYPAAAAALDFGITVDGMTTGLEAGAWWLPSSEEVYLLMHDRVCFAADVEKDPVNRTLLRLKATTCYGYYYYVHTSCEMQESYIYIYNGRGGYLGYTGKCYKYSSRPVCAL